MRDALKAAAATTVLATFLCVGVALGGAEVDAAGAATPRSGPTQFDALHKHVRVLPNVNFALPPRSAGCTGPVHPIGTGMRIPMTVDSVAGQAEELVNVCLDGKGPYPFEIDTGAGTSVIATQLEDQLKLPDIGAPMKAGGLGCSVTFQAVSVPSWSVAGLDLAPQNLISTTQPYFGTKGQADGLLGSDVLSRFGAVRFDFAARTLTFAGPEGSAPSTTGVITGPTGPPPSAAVTDGETGTTVAATVDSSPNGTEMTVPLRFGDGPNLVFDVDTGTNQTTVSSQVAQSEHLVSANLDTAYATVCSVGAVPLVHSGTWSLPGVPLHPELIPTQKFTTADDGDLSGTLGSELLVKFGWVVLDYSGGRLILG